MSSNEQNMENPERAGNLAADNFFGIVLAGGMSSRMGADKALLRVCGGRSLLQSAYARLESVLKPVYASCRKDCRYAGYPSITDEYADLGPVGGIVSALRLAERESFAGILATPCDMPLLPAFLLEKLLCAAFGAPENILAVHYLRSWDNWDEMLAAVYFTSSLPLLEEGILNGKRSMRQIIPEDARLRIPYGRDMEKYFLNCNSPEDLSKIRELMQASDS